MAGNKSVILSLLGNSTKARESIIEVEDALDKLREKSKEVIVGAETGDSKEKILSLDDALEKFKIAATEAADATKRLAELEKSGSSSAGQLAAAQDALKTSTKGMRDAQLELGRAELASSDKAAVAAAKQEELAAKTKIAATDTKETSHHFGLAALGIAGAAAVFVDMGAKFQDTTTHLVTDAGESARNLGMVQQGILQISAATGTSAADITNAMYHIESAGFHGASGLALLKTAAEGARVGGADLDTVSRVLVGTMNAYGMSSKNAAVQQQMATAMMNQMIATVGAGDMRMQDLAGSMSAVTPIAASAHISFAQVGGAIATMTAQGMSAQQATQDLANAIRNMLSPNHVASTEMKLLGVNANDVATHLGKRGLTGTLQMYTEAILANTHHGSVMINYMKQMSPAAQGLARGLLAGELSTKQLHKAMQSLTPVQAHLVTMFNASAMSATGLKQTYDSAMAKMTGGATGLNVALMLSGDHMKTFEHNTNLVGDAAKAGGDNVANWSTIQHTLTFQLDKAKQSAMDLGITIGLKLIPPAMAIVVPVATFLTTLMKLPGAGIAVVGLALTFVSLWAAVKIGAGAKEMFDGISGALKVMKVAMFGAAEGEAAAEGATIGLNLAFLASPITWLIIGLVALGVGIYELAKHSKAFRDFWKEVWRDINIALDVSRHFIMVAFDSVRHQVANFAHNFAAYFSEIRGHIHAWYSDIVNIGGAVISWFGQLPGRIWRTLGNFGNLLTSIGKDLISGLIHGIEAQVSSLLGTIGNVGGMISGAFKSVLHIFSPSRVFFDHGMNIVLGLVSGINGYAHLAESAVGSLAQRAIGASGGRFTGGTGGQGSALTAEWIGGAGADQEFITWLKKNIRIRGGNPAVLGR